MYVCMLVSSCVSNALLCFEREVVLCFGKPNDSDSANRLNRNSPSPLSLFSSGVVRSGRFGGGAAARFDSLSLSLSPFSSSSSGFSESRTGRVVGEGERGDKPTAPPPSSMDGMSGLGPLSSDGQLRHSQAVSGSRPGPTSSTN